MEDFVERFMSRMRGLSLTPKEYRKELMSLCWSAAEYWGDKQIIFNARQRRKINMREKINTEKLLNELMFFIDGVMNDRQKLFERYDYRYTYFHKDIK